MARLIHGRHLKHFFSSDAYMMLTIASTMLLVMVEPASAQSEPPLLIRIETKDGSQYVGEFATEGPGEVRVFDFKANRLVSVAKESIITTEKPISLNDAARYAGLPAVLGRQISQLADRAAPVGKIAKVGSQVVYLTVGESAGLVVGQRVTVFRNEGDIIDPDTGTVLATERPRIAELEVTEVNRNVSKARITGDLEVKLEIGDEVEPEISEFVVAVSPVADEFGRTNATGLNIAEELTGELVQRGVSVVERSAMDKILRELLVQNTILFDETSAQKLGKLTGASMVVTGRIIQEETTGTAHLRLINARTGHVVLAASAPVTLASKDVVMHTSDGPVIPSPATVDPTPSGKFESLGRTRELPNWLTTTSALERTPEGGVRFQGAKMHHDVTNNIIVTRERDFLYRNFIFEVLVTFGPDDGIAHIGFGTGRQEGSANRREDSLYLRFHSPHHGEGQVGLAAHKKSEVPVGKVPQYGVHLVRLTKTGDSLTFEVDPENDGPTDDDMESVVADVRSFVRTLNSKNCHLFLGGTATYLSARLEILP